MEGNTTISVWLILGGLLVIGVVYCVYQYHFRNKTPEKNAMSNILPENTVNGIWTEFKLKIKYFSGVMNALWDVAMNPDLSFLKITFDNIEQIINVKGTDEMKTWYSNFGKDRNAWDIVLYTDKAKEMMDILIKCGICPHKEKELVWDDEFLKKYNRLSQIQPGQECLVVAPYWVYNGEIFEKGLVKAK